MLEKRATRGRADAAELTVSSPVEELLSGRAQFRETDRLETGRYLVTFRVPGAEHASRWLSGLGLRTADTRDFDGQGVRFDGVRGSDALLFAEIGVALVAQSGVERFTFDVNDRDVPAGSPLEAVEPEYFAFPQGSAAADTDLCATPAESAATDATMGLTQCRVARSPQSGAGIKVGIVDGGMDLGHPDFASRTFVTRSFVRSPMDDLLGHATHVTGTACGPLQQPGVRPRYGIGYDTSIFIAKVAGASSATGVVLAGLNWAIANRCAVIFTSLGSQTRVQAAYTAAGAAALSRGSLIVAPVGSSASPTGAPANSPTILAATSLDRSLTPSPFSNFGKVDVAAPGRDVLSAIPGPVLYAVRSGTSIAAAHVAGCAALWAQVGPGVRGPALWKALQSSALPLEAAPSKVGCGLVQAP